MDLDALLAPRSIAVVGASATPGSVGATTLEGLLAGGYRGRVHPVNPRHRELAGLPCVPSLADLGESVDLAVLAVANAGLEAQLDLAARTGARAAVAFASALSEPGLGRRLRDRASAAAMPLCGPNGMGFVNATRGLRVCGYQLPLPLEPGPVALVSHSGSSFSALLHNDRGLRFGLAVSPGLELVTTSADYLGYAASLDGTRVVALLLEQIRDFPAFAEAVADAHRRDVTVVVLKVGSDERSRPLVAAHSGALAGEDGAYDAFFDECGIHRVRTLDELADTVELFVPRRRAGPGGLAAVTDSGGERALLVDLAGGIPLAVPSPATTARLAAVLDPGLPAVNPVDAWGTGADAERVFAETLAALAADDDTAVSLFAVDLTGGGWPRYVDVAVDTWRAARKPFAVLTNYPGGMNPEAARRLRSAGVPLLEGTATGLAAVRHLLDDRDFSLRPPREPRPRPPTAAGAWRDRLTGTERLGEAETLSLLADWGIPVAASAVVTTEAAALDAASTLGWPVALKTASGLAHKSDAGGVHLDIRDGDELAPAYRAICDRFGPAVTVQAMAPAGVELALGVVHEPGLGPLVVVAAGGVLVELLGDRALAVPPLDRQRARRLLDRLAVRRLLGGWRGRPAVDVDSAVDVVVALSHLAVDLAGTFEALDLNPLIAHAAGCVAVDALLVGRGTG